MVKHGGSVTTKHKESLRKQTQNLGALQLKARRDPIRGIIYAIKSGPEGEYFYEVKVRPNRSAANQTENYTPGAEAELSQADVWLPLAEDPSVIALLYGDKDMILDSKCRIEYPAATPVNGIVFIEFDPNRRKLRKNATEFEKKAFLYATAGGGKLT